MCNFYPSQTILEGGTKEEIRCFENLHFIFVKPSKIDVWGLFTCRTVQFPPSAHFQEHGPQTTILEGRTNLPEHLSTHFSRVWVLDLPSKSGFPLLFLLPKSSFGRDKVSQCFVFLNMMLKWELASIAHRPSPDAGVLVAPGLVVPVWHTSSSLMRSSHCCTRVATQRGQRNRKIWAHLILGYEPR